MLGAYVREHGPAESIVWDELPDPRPGPGEVLVRTLAVAADHVDTFVRSGAFHTEVTWPLVVGRDLVGAVLDADPQTSFAPGQLVWTSSAGYEGRPGATSEQALVQAPRCYPVPAGLDPVDVVATLHGTTTAVLALRRCGLGPAEHVFVHGAGGGVGSAVVQASLDAGARVTATARDDASLAWLRALAGEVRVVDTRTEEPAPHDVDVHWDAAGTIGMTTALRSLSTGGRVVVTARRQTDPVPLGDLYLADQSVVGFVLSRADEADLSWAALETNRLLSGGLRVRVSTVLPMSEAARAHQLLEGGAAHGKIVLVPA